MTKITFVTGNKNKLKEVVAILSQGGPSEESKVGNFEIVSESIDLDEVQGTIEEVTLHKAKSAAKLLNRAVLVEDTALGFRAMNNLPGPYIKWFLKSLGLDGLNKMLYKFDDKTAYATCTFGLCLSPDSEPILFQGITEGEIVSARGPTNFGWDPIFQPKGFDTTYAEMDGKTKNTISHRYKALEKLREYLLQN
ncbi:unnamed protein product [Kuraishia capsulata CBS 1993]|uniref:Inosine triphosphate pyrophosphatase n=1 Tax=Kuraishia capsulata CBS 1993 TaxID=1382522 RepID=W6MFD4_9ASCO|nr:uncharacterized protein KUCA_T00000452001 [Kuraishia capsulata CBS 1993]CDK24489.1 unnamed protein product [Kuraishia capsulata CBS 1993]